MRIPNDYGKLVYYPIYTKDGYDIGKGFLLAEYISETGDKVFIVTANENINSVNSIRRVRSGYALTEEDAFKLLKNFREKL